MSSMPGVKGDTYGIDIDLKSGVVKIGDQVVTEKLAEARIFSMAYRLGREHKKNQIRNALGI